MTNFAPKLIKLIHSVGKGSRAGDPLKIMEDLEEDLAYLYPCMYILLMEYMEISCINRAKSSKRTNARGDHRSYSGMGQEMDLEIDGQEGCTHSFVPAMCVVYYQ